MTFTRWISYWLLAGVMIPVMFVGEAHIRSGLFAWPRLVIALWPSSLYLLMSECVACSWIDRWLIIPGISVGANVILYATVGTVTWPLYKVLRRPHGGLS
jgi:hypothetical protein